MLLKNLNLQESHFQNSMQYIFYHLKLIVLRNYSKTFLTQNNHNMESCTYFLVMQLHKN